MAVLVRLKGSCTQLPNALSVFFSAAYTSSCEIQKITKIINDHPFPEQPLQPTLCNHIPPTLLSPQFVENVLGSLFAAHSNGLKALEFFNFSLRQSEAPPTSDAFEKTLHILTRMRYFDKAWELMIQMRQRHPSLLTLKSMSIMLSKIAKFQSYEDTLEAFKRMETDIFAERNFGAEEFNVLLRAFCTNKAMKEARSVFHKMHLRFSPNTKTMNILLLGFKQSGDITAMELFYHEMLRRGFKPNPATYNIRIDAYCKKGCLGDALRLLQEMESFNCFPTIEIMTTLIHGSGVARNTLKARQLFHEIPKRNLEPDIGAYNALISSLIRSRDLKSAMELMEEMEEKKIGYDGVTYHAMFVGAMKLAGIEGVQELFTRMVERNFLPKTQTVVMIMKYFCEIDQLDLGLSLWEYLIQKGCCPHSHALDLLVTGLSSRGRFKEAFECCRVMLERGRQPSETVYNMLRRHLEQTEDTKKLSKLNNMITKLQSVLPAPANRSIYVSP